MKRFFLKNLNFEISAVFIICLIFFIPFFINPKVITQKDNDLGRTYIPLFTFIKNSILINGQVPLWRPDQLMGEPFVGNPLSSLFYPVNIIFILTSVKFGAVIYLFIHFLFAAISTYFLAKSFGLSARSSFTAAIFYAFSFKMLFHFSAGHITMVAAFAIFPLLFLAIGKILTANDSYKRKAWIIISAISFSLMYILYPTIFYYAAIFVLLYIFYYLFLSRKPRLKLIFPLMSPFLIVFLLTIGFSAIQLLPQLEFAPFSTRTSLKLTDVALPLWNVKRFLTSLLLPYLNFDNFDHEAFLYLGLIPSTLFILGFLNLKNRQKIFLVIIGFLTLAFIAGLSTPIFKTAYDFVPFLKYSRITTRLWFAVSLVVALVAAFGIEKIKNRKLYFLIIALFILESFAIGYKKILTVPNLHFGDESIYQFIADDKDIFRVYCASYCFNPQMLSKYKIQVLNGETPIQYAKFTEFLAMAGNYKQEQFAVIFPPYQVWQNSSLSIPNAALLGYANVKYVASTYQINDENFPLLNKFGNIYFYQNKKYLPRAFFENSDDLPKIEKYSPNSIVLSFEERGVPRRLIFSENYYPDWFARIDNKRFKIEPYQFNLRSVIIPANYDRAEIEYSPRSLAIGKSISFATIFFTALWYIHKRRPKAWQK